jgi:HlyD family secretion protein
MLRFVVWLLVLAGAGAGAWHFYGESIAQTPPEASYRTALVERGPIVATVSATGTVNPTATALVGSQLSGQVVEIFVDYNSEVKAGQVLARLNSEQVRARHDAAKADLAQTRATNAIHRAQVEKNKADLARAAASRADFEAQKTRAETLLADAERTLARQTELQSRGIASEVALQQARTQRDSQRSARDSALAQIQSQEAQLQALLAETKVAEAQVLVSAAQIEQKEAQVRQIEVDIRNSEVRSPVDGVVIQRSIELGQTVAASLQAPTLFLVAQDLTRVEIYANVDEADVGRVQAGQEVSFSVNAFPNRTFTGRVKLVRLGSQTVQNVVIYTAVIEVDNTDAALKPGMTANLRIFTERRQNVLRVPNAALRWRPPAQPGDVATAAPQAARRPADETGMAEGERPRGQGQRGQGQRGEGPRGEFQRGEFQRGPGGQGFGPLAERVASELGLDEAQQAKLQVIVQDLRRSFQEGQDGQQASPGQRRERARDLRATFIARVEEFLTPEQKTKFEALRSEVTVGRTQRAAEGSPGRIYTVGADGKPVVVFVRTLATDGSFTEIAGGALAEGQAVITGGAPRAAAAPRGLRLGF